MIEGKTKSGIEFSIDEAVLDDPRLLRRITAFDKYKESDPMKAIKEVMDFLSLIFGSDDNFDVFLNEIAAHHEGVCNTKIFIEELSEIISKLKIKN